ncbi:MAG: serine/threonine-protein kinase [Polyangia bacterium]
MGERFGNYDLIEKIAVGGMAEIFKARAAHGSGVEKLVCIKRIHPALSADKNFVAMFIDEARLGVSMVHGNIVPVFDFGYVDGHYFLAMEYVEGQDLATLCGRAKVVGIEWPLELAVHVVSEILEGLAYAHHKRDDQGRPLQLVHRDVSPSNVLLSDDGQVKLLDFGIARSLAREFETRTGVIKGKPGYMSPEQAAGGEVDARADVWSCGSLLHELVTGEKLKDGRRPSGDPELEAILDSALSADRERRFQTADEMQHALEDLLAARGLRGSARDLAAFIERIESARAPGEDWDMRSTAVERHLAAALGPAEEREPSAAESNGDDSPPTPTHELEAPPRRSLRRLSVWLISAALLAGAGITAALKLAGENEPDEIAALDSNETEREETGASSELGSQLPAERRDPKPSAANLSIRSDPPGAEIRIDGESTGRETPAELALESGEHGVELRLEGRERWSETIEVDGDGPLELSAELAPAGGSIEVETVPEGAEISIGGTLRGAAPLLIENLPAGEHRVVARASGHLPAREVAVVRGGRKTGISLELEARPEHPARPATKKKGTFSVNTFPWSNVVLDGTAIGTTPIRGRQISAGRHSVVLTNPVKEISKTMRFSVEPGEHEKISARLEDKAPGDE